MVVAHTNTRAHIVTHTQGVFGGIFIDLGTVAQFDSTGNATAVR